MAVRCVQISEYPDMMSGWFTVVFSSFFRHVCPSFLYLLGSN